MSIQKLIIEYIANIMWPWIKTDVWPVIRDKILSEIPNLLDWFILKITDLISDKSRQREKEATEKAEEAKKKASTTEDPSAADFYRREAEIWKKVAEQYKNDLEDIKSKVNDIEKEMKSEIITEVNKIDPDLSITKDGASVKIGDQTTNIPKLPS